MSRTRRQKTPSKSTGARELGKIERVRRATPLSVTKFPPKTKRYLAKSLPRLARKISKPRLQQELNAIKTRRVQPQFSRVSAVASCKRKKAKARHDYFSMRAAGKGARRIFKKTNRFTVRC